jgi:hypothetical protein
MRPSLVASHQCTKNRGQDPGFLSVRRSVCPDVTSSIAIAGRVVSGVAEVLDMRVVSTEDIGGGRTLGNGSVGIAVVVVPRYLTAGPG